MRRLQAYLSKRSSQHRQIRGQLCYIPYPSMSLAITSAAVSSQHIANQWIGYLWYAWRDDMTHQSRSSAQIARALNAELLFLQPASAIDCFLGVVNCLLRARKSSPTQSPCMRRERLFPWAIPRGSYDYSSARLSEFGFPPAVHRCQQL